MMCSTNVNLGSADVVQLNHDDADWSDLIEISDVTRTVYISFDAQERPQPASSERLQPPQCATFFFALIFLLSHHHGGEI